MAVRRFERPQAPARYYDKPIAYGTVRCERRGPREQLGLVSRQTGVWERWTIVRCHRKNSEPDPFGDGEDQVSIFLLASVHEA